MPSIIPQLNAIEQTQVRDLPDFRVGDTVKVHFRISEGEKDRVQIFQGTVIRKSAGGVGATFAVRKTSYGVGVERIFPLHSPRIEQVEIGFRGRVRQARLYYMRELEGKKARLRESTRERVANKAKPSKAPAPAAGTSEG
jgi:large subunit ribosomal protein L19